MKFLRNSEEGVASLTSRDKMLTNADAAEAHAQRLRREQMGSKIILPIVALLLLGSMDRAPSAPPSKKAPGNGAGSVVPGRGREPVEKGGVHSKYPKSLNDFYKGTWELSNSSSMPELLRRRGGHVVFQIVTRRIYMQDDRLPTFSSDGALDFGGDLDEEETKALAPVKVGGAVGGGVGEGKGQIDLVQVDLVFREGKYSSPRDLHSFLHGEYDQASGRLSLWSLCDSPECMISSGGKPKNGTAIEHVPRKTGVHVQDSKQESCLFRMDLQVRPSERLPGGVVGEGGKGKGKEPIVIAGNVTSENCRVEMRVNATAMRFDVYYAKAMNYTLMVTAASFIQVLLLVRQIAHTTSHNSANKVSLVTIGQQAIIDSYLCLVHLTTGIVVEALFNAFATTAFFKFMIFSVFEMRYLLLIWKARRPQGFQDGWESMRRELSMLYSRFYAFLLGGIVVIYQMQKYPEILIVLGYSFWVPQIYHSARNDHRKPLLKRYILGISITRLLVPLYALACPNNFFHSEPSYTFAASLVGWMAFQVLVLMVQHYKGPRCFVPSALLPMRYNYYRVPPNDTSTEQDCAICMMPVAVGGGVSGDGEASGGGAEADIEEGGIGANGAGGVEGGGHAVTPCDHVFHHSCLRQWMELKMECPICRRELPNLDEDEDEEED